VLFIPLVLFAGFFIGSVRYLLATIWQPQIGSSNNAKIVKREFIIYVQLFCAICNVNAMESTSYSIFFLHLPPGQCHAPCTVSPGGKSSSLKAPNYASLVQIFGAKAHLSQLSKVGNYEKLLRVTEM